MVTAVTRLMTKRCLTVCAARAKAAQDAAQKKAIETRPRADPRGDPGGEVGAVAMVSRPQLRTAAQDPFLAVLLGCAIALLILAALPASAVPWLAAARIVVAGRQVFALCGAAGLVIVFVVVRWVVDSSPGRVWRAIRENELRVEVLGLRPYVFKLMSFVLASFLATAGGVVYLLLLGGATTDVTGANFTLTLLVMVVIGGTGTRWGALVGGILYTYANQRLGDATSSHAVSRLPSLLRTPLEQPLFVLGVLFILVVFFVPGGLTQLGRVRRPKALQRLQEAMQR